MLSVPVSIGPMVLRIALLVAVPAIAAFTALRGFVPEPGRTATASVAVAAVGAIVLELMLSAGLALPPQVVVLLLAFSAVPVWLTLTRDERMARFVAYGRRSAPWVVTVMAVAAFVTFGRAWLAGAVPLGVVHTAIVFALTGLSWFTLCRPPAGGVLRTIASVLAAGTLMCTAYATAAQRFEQAAVVTTEFPGGDAIRKA